MRDKRSSHGLNADRTRIVSVFHPCFSVALSGLCGLGELRGSRERVFKSSLTCPNRRVPVACPKRRQSRNKANSKRKQSKFKARFPLYTRRFPEEYHRDGTTL